MQLQIGNLLFPTVACNHAFVKVLDLSSTGKHYKCHAAIMIYKHAQKICIRDQSLFIALGEEEEGVGGFEGITRF